MRRQAARDDDVDDDPQVAGAAAAQRRHAAAVHDDRLPRLRAGGDVQRDVAVERRHLDLGAERGQRRGDVDHGDEVLAVADEALVLLDAHDDVEVAGRPAALARVAAAGHAQALAVLDPRRDVDLHVPLRRDHPAPGAGVARLLGDPAVAAALVAQRGADHLAEARCAARPGSGPRRGSLSQVTIGVPGSAPLPWQVSHSAVAS